MLWWIDSTDEKKPEPTGPTVQDFLDWFRGEHPNDLV